MWAVVTASVTVAGLTLALLGAAPFVSAPVSVTVYVLFGVIWPFRALVPTLPPQAGSSNKLPAINIKRNKASSFLLEPRGRRAPARASPGTTSQKA